MNPPTAHAVRSAGKHPAFEGEDEWRLITRDILQNGEPVKGGTELQNFYRAVFGRIVPYKVYAPTPFRPSRLVIGPSAAMAPHDPPLALLLEDAGCPNLPMERSSIPVRP